jgi:hypothetical protein
MRKDTQILGLSRSTALLLGLACAAGAQAATPSFAAQQAFAAGYAPTSAVSADLNGDGQLDLVMTDAGDSAIVVLVSTTTSGAISASFATQQVVPVESAPWSVAVVDVNKDGKPDLVVTYEVGDVPSAQISVLLNTTLPGATSVSFAPAQDFLTGNGNFPTVTAADLDSDGKYDLIVANDLDGTLSVLLNTTTVGSLTASFADQQVFAVGTGPSSIAVGDLNGDSLKDLAIANSGDGTVSVLLNTTSGGVFALADQQVFTAGIDAGGIALGDLNGDGMPDLVLANYAGTQAVSVLINATAAGSATVSFAAEQTFGVRNPGPLSVAVVDLDGSGLPDLVVTDYKDAELWVLPNTASAGSSSAAFGTAQPFATGTAPYSVTTADINGDGQMDLVAVDMGSAGISVLLNSDADSAIGVNESLLGGAANSGSTAACQPGHNPGARRGKLKGSPVKTGCGIKTVIRKH